MQWNKSKGVWGSQIRIREIGNHLQIQNYAHCSDHCSLLLLSPCIAVIMFTKAYYRTDRAQVQTNRNCCEIQITQQNQLIFAQKILHKGLSILHLQSWEDSCLIDHGFSPANPHCSHTFTTSEWCCKVTREAGNVWVVRELYFPLQQKSEQIS